MIELTQAQAEALDRAEQPPVAVDPRTKQEHLFSACPPDHLTKWRASREGAQSATEPSESQTMATDLINCSTSPSPRGVGAHALVRRGIAGESVPTTGLQKAAALKAGGGGTGQ